MVQRARPRSHGYLQDITPNFITEGAQMKASSTEFWVNMFAPRTDKWKRETLKRLTNSVNPFDNAEEVENKVEALRTLLN